MTLDAKRKEKLDFAMKYCIVCHHLLILVLFQISMAWDVKEKGGKYLRFLFFYTIR